MYNKLKLDLKELPTNIFIYKPKLYKTLVYNLFKSVKECLKQELDIFCQHKNHL